MIKYWIGSKQSSMSLLLLLLSNCSNFWISWFVAMIFEDFFGIWDEGKPTNHVRNDRKSVMPENTFFNL